MPVFKRIRFKPATSGRELMRAAVASYASRGGRSAGGLALIAILLASLIVMNAAGMLPRGASHPPAATPGSSPLQLHAAARPSATGSTSVSVGATPTRAVYDPGNGLVYVVNMASGTVSIIQGSSVVKTVTVGSYPVSAVYDPSNGFVYVLNFNGSPPGSVSVLNGTSLIATVVVGNNPVAGAYDGANGFVYIANEASGTVSVLSGTSVLANVTVGPMPEWALEDPVDGHVYVGSAYGSTNVSVLNGTQLLGTVNIGGTSQTAACDRATGWVYVPLLWNNSVTVLNGTRIVASVTVGPVGSTPGAAFYDSSSGAIYVTDPGAYTVMVVRGTTVSATIYLGATPGDATNPTSIGSDPVDGFVYVLEPTANQLTVINGTQVVGVEIPGVDPVSVAYDAANGRTYVVNEMSGNVTMLPAGYPITVTEVGLPAGSSWWVNVSGNPIGVVAWHVAGSAASFREPNGSYDYYLGSDDPAYSGGSGAFTVAGAPVSLNGSFSPVVYPVMFIERGLPGGTVWSVGLAGTDQNTSGTTLTFSETGGVWNYSVGLVPGWNCSPRFGSLNITAPVVLYLEWTVFTYPIRFHETGLPNGTGWGLLVGSRAASSLTPNVTLALPNGTYGYVILPAEGYETSGSGTFTVNGSSVAIAVTFHRQLYAVVFVEFGLPTGSNWSVTATNQSMGINDSQSSSTNSIVLFLPNGTYRVTFTLPAGYSGNVSATQITVAGRATLGPSWTRSPGPSGTTGWMVTMGTVLPWLIVGTLAGLGLLGLLGARWKGRERERGRWLVDELLGQGAPKDPAERTESRERTH